MEAKPTFPSSSGPLPSLSFPSISSTFMSLKQFLPLSKTNDCQLQHPDPLPNVPTLFQWPSWMGKRNGLNVRLGSSSNSIWGALEHSDAFCILIPPSEDCQCIWVLYPTTTPTELLSVQTIVVHCSFEEERLKDYEAGLGIYRKDSNRIFHFPKITD